MVAEVVSEMQSKKMVTTTQTNHQSQARHVEQRTTQGSMERRPNQASEATPGQACGLAGLTCLGSKQQQPAQPARAD